jgi:hypothetical protein
MYSAKYTQTLEWSANILSWEYMGIPNTRSLSPAATDKASLQNPIDPFFDIQPLTRRPVQKSLSGNEAIQWDNRQNTQPMQQHGVLHQTAIFFLRGIFPFGNKFSSKLCSNRIFS